MCQDGGRRACCVVRCSVFLKSKFGKTATKSLRVALSDFCSDEELSVAKQQLLEDISDMKSSVKFPYVQRRRDGDDKATRVPCNG